ncbi:MAG: serine hydrolase domain-containing protein [Devosia sp.]
MNPISPAAVARFEQLIREEVEDKQLPSMSYVIVDRDGIRSKGHVRRNDLEHRMDDATEFRIGSITKTFTAICMMQLVEEGLVDLDADVATYIPHFKPTNPFADAPGGPFGNAVTVRKLMSHTAGMVREPKSGHYLDAHRPSLAATVDELAVSTLKLDPSAGIFSYSNAGIAVVGSIIERVTGKPFSEVLQARILSPLGMSATSITMTPEIARNIAPAIMWSVEGDEPAPVFDLGGSPAGNIFSTLDDMGKYAICLLRGGFAADGTSIVSPGSLAEMWEVAGKRLPGSTFKGYGLGFGIGDVDGWKSVGHGGAVYGFATQLSVLPSAGVGIVTFSTLDGGNQVASRLASDGLRTILEANHMGKGMVLPTRPGAVSQEQMGTLPGRFRSADGKDVVEVRVAQGRLFLMGDGVPLEIKPTSDTGFVIDGRIYAHGADYPHMTLEFPSADSLVWKGTTWSRMAVTPQDPVPADIAPHLGEYGPDFNITYLTYRDGQLKCLIEYFFTHDCEPVGGNRFKMQGMLYPDEILELGATENGKTGIRVGPMFLERRA